MAGLPSGAGFTPAELHDLARPHSEERPQFPIESSANITNISSTGIPIIKTFIDDFIVKEGDPLYYAFGEWTQSAHILAFVGEKADINVAIEFLRTSNSADYFLKEFKNKNVPKGIIDSLKIIAELKTKEKIVERDIKALSRAITTIYEMMLS